MLTTLDHRSPVSRFYLPGGLILICLLLQALGMEELLRFDRDKLDDGDYWLLLSAHFVHLNWSHFLLNMIGLMLLCYLLEPRFTTLTWVSLLVFVSAATGFALYWLNPSVYWYVGFSGSLHGVFAAALITQAKNREPLSWLLIFALIVKLILEQYYGAPNSTAELIGGDVIVDAHLYGAIAGLGYAGIILLHRQLKSKPQTRA